MQISMYKMSKILWILVCLITCVVVSKDCEIGSWLKYFLLMTNRIPTAGAHQLCLFLIAIDSPSLFSGFFVISKSIFFCNPDGI